LESTSGSTPSKKARKKVYFFARWETPALISLLRTTGRACCQSGCTVLQKLNQARQLTSSTTPRVQHAPAWRPKNLRGMISVYNIFFSALMDIGRVSTTARVKKFLPGNLPNSNYPLGITTKENLKMLNID